MWLSLVSIKLGFKKADCVDDGWYWLILGVIIKQSYLNKLHQIEPTKMFNFFSHGLINFTEIQAALFLSES